MNISSPITENTAKGGAKTLNYPQLFGGGVFFLVAAAVANTFNSALALPFASIAGAQFFTIAAVKLFNEHYPKQTKKLLLNSIIFKERYPSLQAVAFVVTLISAYVWGFLGCVFGIFSGFYSGLLIKSDYIKDLRANYKAPQQPVSVQIAHN